jgi:DNA gyrase subunit A
MFITESGMIVRSRIADVSTMSRNTQGVKLVNLKQEDRLVAAAIVASEDLERFGDGDEEDDVSPEGDGAPAAEADQATLEETSSDEPGAAGEE